MSETKDAKHKTNSNIIYNNKCQAKTLQVLIFRNTIHYINTHKTRKKAKKVSQKMLPLKHSSTLATAIFARETHYF